MRIQRRRLFRGALASGLAWLILGTPSISMAWGAGGHMIAAYIAYDRLNPRAKAKAKELLKREIDPEKVSEKTKDFVNAAHWADDIRPFPGFEYTPPLHFVDFPFSIDGTPIPDLPDPNNIVRALNDNVKILRISSDKNAQAQALRFIIHFVGDIHQPLHCATRVDGSHSRGDQGGNMMAVIASDQEGKLRSVRLHSLWDGGIGSFPAGGPPPSFSAPSLKTISAAASKAMKDNPDSDPELKLDEPFNFDIWAKESLILARDVAYKDIQAGAVVTTTYKMRALRVVDQRIAWAGYRLAALLNAIWP